MSSATPTPRDVLTPEALAMLQVIAKTGSFAAAARSLGQVPSALTYRIRQMEDEVWKSPKQWQIDDLREYFYN